MSRVVAPPSQQEIDSYYNRAVNGDIAAINWLNKQNNAVGKRANERMRYLERSGYVDESGGTAAYERAQDYLSNQLGRSRYFTGKIKEGSFQWDIDTVVENLENASQFLRYQTSTVRGELARREKIFDSLSEGGYITMPENPIEADRFKKRFNRFLESDAWKDLKNSIGTNIIKQASEAIQSGARVGDLINLYKQYESSENIDLFDVWDSWTAGKRKIKV